MEKLKAEIERLRGMASFSEHNPNPIIEFDAQGQILYQNEATFRMVQSLRKEKVEEILPPEVVEIVKDCMRTDRPRLRRELEISSRSVSWSFFPIKATQTVHCYGGDITERLVLEAELRQAQKMDSIGKLAGGIAHDFNNMLTAISGYAGMLQLMPSIPESGQKAIQQIQMASDRAADLTRQLLLFSKKQMVRVELLDLGEVVTVATNLGQGFYKVNGDRSMLEQVLLNLLVNARDAMPLGGKANIELDSVEIMEEQLGLRRTVGSRTGSFIRLTVRDTGMGISPETMAHIFEPFYTTKKPGEGTGLGLSTVYAIVKQHDGWIEVESKANQGTAFHIHLPRVHYGEVAALTSPAATFVHGKGRVLVVEDESSVRVLAVTILKECGYDIIAACSASEAMEKWEAEGGRFDLLFTDVVMPGGYSGQELADELLKKKADLKVLFTSGYSFDALKELPPGAQFLKKPYSIFSLASSVQAAMALK
jgi:two-component system, cell cycle sensor histidine kinase and response regulator CckA